MNKREYYEKMNKLLIFYNKYELDNNDQNKKFTPEEYKTGYEMLKDYTTEQFDEFIELMLKKMEYFSLANLKKIIEDVENTEKLRKSLGLKTWDELYEN